MKKFAIRTLFVAAAVIGLAAQATQAQVSVSVTIGGFYDELTPYGRWVDCRYGQCWVPARVAADWQPYSNGQWIYTEYGWTWVSNDPWGGNPYHYGTWALIEGYGWCWVPGTVWAPAWVTWSYSNNYIGWAPLPPTLVFGASGYAGRPVVVSQTQYVFVPTNRFVGRNVAAVRIPAAQIAAIFRQTKPVTSFGVMGGIVRNTALPMETIERAAGEKIETRSIQTAGTAPRVVSAGTARLAVVAPAREMKAAAARPQAAPRSPEPQAVPRSPAPAQEEKHAKAPVDRGPLVRNLQKAMTHRRRNRSPSRLRRLRRTLKTRLARRKRVGPPSRPPSPRRMPGKRSRLRRTRSLTERRTRSLQEKDPE